MISLTKLIPRHLSNEDHLIPLPRPKLSYKTFIDDVLHTSQNGWLVGAYIRSPTVHDRLGVSTHLPNLESCQYLTQKDHWIACSRWVGNYELDRNPTLYFNGSCRTDWLIFSTEKTHLIEFGINNPFLSLHHYKRKLNSHGWWGVGGPLCRVQISWG